MKVFSVPSPFKADGPWELQTYSVRIPDLMEDLAPSARYGGYILRQAQEWLKGKVFADPYGYPLPMSEDQQERWREYKLKELAHCLDTISTFCEQVEKFGG